MLNLLKAQDALKNSSDQQLVQMMHSPSAGAPSFLVMTEIKRRADMRKNAGPGGYPEGTLAEEYSTQMMPQPLMPQQMPMMPQQMAPQMPQQQMMPEQDMQGFAGGGPVQHFQTGREVIGSNPGIFSSQNGWKSIWDRLNFRREDYAQPGGFWNPRTGQWEEEPSLMGIPGSARRGNAGDTGIILDPNARGIAMAPPIPGAVNPSMPDIPNAPSAPAGIDPYAGYDMNQMPEQRRPVAQPGMPRPGAAGGAGGGSPLGSYEQYLQQARNMAGSANDPQAAIREQMRELQVDPEKMKSDALSNALMTAGFGMMSARGNLASAIGQGGLAGLSAYNRGIGDVRQQRLQNLGVESKIAEAQAAAARGDRALALELMKEANTSDYRNRALGLQAHASNRADARAETSLKIAMIRRQGDMSREVSKRFKELESTDLDLKTNPVKRQAAIKMIWDEVQREFASGELGQAPQGSQGVLSYGDLVGE